MGIRAYENVHDLVGVDCRKAMRGVGRNNDHVSRTHCLAYAADDFTTRSGGTARPVGGAGLRVFEILYSAARIENRVARNDVVNLSDVTVLDPSSARSVHRRL